MFPARLPLLVLLACCFVQAEAIQDTVRPLRWDVAVRLDAASLGMNLYQPSLANRIHLEPNNPPRLGLSVRYEGMGGGFGFTSGKLHEDRDVETQCWDLQWFLYFPRLGFDLYLQSYEGYAARSDSVAEIVFHPNLTMSTQTFSIYAKLVGNVGVDAMDKPIARKEWISILLYTMADVSHRTMESSAPVVPPPLRDRYGSLASLDRIDVVVPSLSFGLFLPVHIGPLYTNAGMSLGGGVPFDRGDGVVRTTQSTKINMKVAMGFEGETGGVGLFVVQDSNAEKLDDAATAQFHSFSMRLFAHQRF